MKTITDNLYDTLLNLTTLNDVCNTDIDLVDEDSGDTLNLRDILENLSQLISTDIK